MQAWQRGATLSDKLLALAVVEVVIREYQVVAARRKRGPSGGQTRNNRDAVRCQELPCNLICENCMILKLEDVHERAYPLFVGCNPHLSRIFCSSL